MPACRSWAVRPTWRRWRGRDDRASGAAALASAGPDPAPAGAQPLGAAPVAAAPGALPGPVHRRGPDRLLARYPHPLAARPRPAPGPGRAVGGGPRAGPAGALRLLARAPAGGTAGGADQCPAGLAVRGGALAECAGGVGRRTGPAHGIRRPQQQPVDPHQPGGQPAEPAAAQPARRHRWPHGQHLDRHGAGGVSVARR